MTGTFSILARSYRPKLMGVAVATGSNYVGERVPHAKPGVGVIATQAYTNVAYGVEGIELLTQGLSPKEVLDRLLMEDPGRELRQVAMMDFEGRKAVFTGSKVPRSWGEILGEDYIVIGNLLADKEVVKRMAEGFGRSRGDLAWRLVCALKAGSEGGGDKRGEKSAALVVVGIDNWNVELKVDVSKDPIEELRHKLKQ